MNTTSQTRYATSGELSIAYQVIGDGPLDLVFVPGFVSHLELSWDLPHLAAVGQRLASFSRLVAFDKRGTGLSDRTAGLPTLAERMDDIRAVMDAAGTERAAVIGVSEGGPTAMLFAATYPERVSALVLWITSAVPPLAEFDEATRAAIAGFDDFIGQHWGDGSTFHLMTGVGAPADEATMERFARYERNAATPAAAQAVWRRSFVSDVRPFLSSISAPTLLVAHPADRLIKIELVRATAAAIPGATLAETDVPGHMSWNVDTEPDLDLIEEFLTGSRVEREPDRVLATVLYTDIVGSTQQAAALGDRRWRQLLDQHDTLIRLELARHRGREVKTTGDGFLAAFDGPARGIRCAHEVVRRARDIGIDVRAGLHTGECEVRGDDLAGIAVHVGARVAALAGAGEVLVSRTVHDLVAGSDIAFDDRGEHDLKGVPGTWQLFSARG